MKLKLCTEQVILQVCDMRHYSLLLHNFDPGYHNKIMLSKEERDAEGKYNTPCLVETPSSSLIDVSFSTAVLRHASSCTDNKSTQTVDMCFTAVMFLTKIATQGIKYLNADSVYK